MNQTVALADEDVRSMLRALSADVQASLALSRAAVTAVAAGSPERITAEQALEDELERARRVMTSQRTVGILEQVQRRLRRMPADQDRVEILERALIAAADALPGQDPQARG